MIANVVTTDTFRTWFETTNEIINYLNTKVVGDNVTAFGTFVIGANADTSLAVSNSVFVNTSLILAKSNTTMAANVSVTANANVFNLASGSLLIQPINGTFVNTAISVNAPASFLSSVSAAANLTVNGTITMNGVIGITGTTTANGIIYARQIAFNSANSVLAPATLTNPQYDDYAPAGLNDAQVLNLTPGIDTVITGLQAPTGLGTTGARVLYIQNLAALYKITLPSANTSSGANNQFKTNADTAVDILPGSAVAVIWSTTNHTWRIISPSLTASSLTLSGNVSIGGTLSVNSTSSFSANASFGTTLVVDQTNGRVGINGTPTVPFQVTGNSILQITAIQGAATFSANLTSTANASLSNTALVLAAPTLSAVFGNTITANSSTQSFIRSLLITTLVSNASATLANVIISGNSSISGVVSITGSAARLVLPVGTGKYAT